MQKYLKIALIPSISLIVLALIMTIFNLFMISVNPLFYLLSILLIMLATGIYTGLITKEKAYIKGLIVGAITALTMFIFSLLFRPHFSFYIIVYYILIITITTLGAMIGVNKKK